jgi:16S rRNA (guanine(966)-N(2))-methyltransferase RsmD
MPRIIAGEFRSRRLLSPPDDEITRPYPDRVRESVFNTLREWFDEESRVLDLFAGVGSMGLEAVSRGATDVLMVERSRPIYRLLQQNIDALGCGDCAKALLGDALGPVCLARAPRPVDLVFLDPPYAMMREAASRQRVLAQAGRCRDVMAERSFLILRSPIGPTEADLSISGFEGPEDHRYGRGMWVSWYQPLLEVETGENT